MLTTETKNPAKQLIQFQLLNELSTGLQRLITNESFYDQIVELVQTKLDYYSIHIWSVGQDGTATLRAQAGAYQGHLTVGDSLPRGAGIIGWVIRNKQTYIANDVSQDQHFTNLSLPVDSQSELCIPVICDGEVLATLNIESDQTNAFDANDVSTAESVAAQIAVAISNRKLFNEVNAFNEKLQHAVDEKTKELKEAHTRILEQQKLLQKENKALKSLVRTDQKNPNIIGESESIRNTISMVDKIAPTPASVLIQGESGTGKELIARRLHFKSDRADAPYVTVNCGALLESLLESELFGHERGSFTGAVQQKIGLAEMADGGTLFLDEVGEMSLNIQAKLLRFLQEGEFYRVGGKKPIRINVRIISATNKDLEQEVKAGRFREDLFYRLNTITLSMPPLRKRAEDIPLLVNHFLTHSRFGGSTNTSRKVDPKVYEVLRKYSWPGNIRELQNTIERIKILAEHQEIRVEDIPFGIRVPKNRAAGGRDTSEFTIEMPLDDLERNHILRVLAYHQGNKTRTAQSLGITIKTLYNKLHRYGVTTPQNES